MSGSVSVHVLTFGLPARIDVLKDRELKRANKNAVSKAGTRGRSLVRATIPVRTGAARAGIRKTTKSAGGTAVAKVFPSGPHRHIAIWQDQGTGGRHKRNGQYTGFVEAQYFFERAAADLEGYLPVVMEAEVEAAIVRSGLA
jgi:hypothetical protein